MENLALTATLATAPSSAFAVLRERPRFWFPLLAVILTSAAIVAWYFTAVDFDWYRDNVLAASPDFQKMAEAERAQALSFMGPKMMLTMSMVGIFFVLPIFYLLNTTYFFVAGKVTKQTPEFKHWFALTCWSAMPAVLSAVVAAIFLLIRDSNQIPPTALQPLGLNELLFNYPLGSKAQGFLDALNIPGILGWILAIIGVQTWTQRSWLFSTIFVMIPVVLIYGIWAIFAFVV